jgi:hypothetical protein
MVAAPQRTSRTQALPIVVLIVPYGEPTSIRITRLQFRLRLLVFGNAPPGRRGCRLRQVIQGEPADLFDFPQVGSSQDTACPGARDEDYDVVVLALSAAMIDPEHTLDHGVGDRHFLGKLALQRGCSALAFLHTTAWKIPVIAIGMPHQRYPLIAIQQQRANTDRARLADTPYEPRYPADHSMLYTHALMSLPAIDAPQWYPRTWSYAPYAFGGTVMQPPCKVIGFVACPERAQTASAL